jgi:hypothetical protein
VAIAEETPRNGAVTDARSSTIFSSFNFVLTSRFKSGG